MSKKIAWVTDSTASFTEDEASWLKENHVFVVPLSVIFGEETYKEGIEISTNQFYEKMSTSGVSPSTSQPTLGDFINLYDELKKEYDAAIVVHVSGKLSGTYSTSVQAASIVDFPIFSVDSWIGSFPLKFYVKAGIEMFHQGVEIPEIIDRLNILREKGRLMLLPASLEQLHKSGRVSNFGSIVGNLLQIKPILAFKEGKVNIVDKVRSFKKAESNLISRFHESYENGIFQNISVLYAGELEAAQKVKEKLEEAYKELKVELMPLIPVAGVHTGVGTIGISWVEK